MTAAPRGRRSSEPAPLLISNGIAPSKAHIGVIIMGRNRSRLALKIASWALIACSRCRPRATSTIMIAFFRYQSEPYLAGAVDCRLWPGFPHLDMAHDVLHDHDRIVDHEPDCDRQRHQRDIVETKAERVHENKRADQR